MADQDGIDLSLAVTGPSGTPVADMDVAEGMRGAERLSLVADATGDFRLVVAVVNGDAVAGRYDLRIAELREAGSHDTARIDAERAFSEGRALYRRGTRDSWRKALDSYRRALPLWQVTGDRTAEA